MHYSLIFREASYMGLYSSAYAEQRLESGKDSARASCSS